MTQALSWKFKKKRKRKEILDLSCFLCVFIECDFWVNQVILSDFRIFRCLPVGKNCSIFSYGETPENSKIAQNVSTKVIRKAAM